MTREDIVRMAKEVGMESFDICVELDDFAKLVAKHEREACADIVDNADTPDCGGWNALGISTAIRARGTT